MKFGFMCMLDNAYMCIDFLVITILFSEEEKSAQISMINIAYMISYFVVGFTIPLTNRISRDMSSDKEQNAIQVSKIGLLGSMSFLIPLVIVCLVYNVEIAGFINIDPKSEVFLYENLKIFA